MQIMYPLSLLSLYYTKWWDGGTGSLSQFIVFFRILLYKIKKIWIIFILEVILQGVNRKCNVVGPLGQVPLTKKIGTVNLSL